MNKKRYGLLGLILCAVVLIFVLIFCNKQNNKEEIIEEDIKTESTETEEVVFIEITTKTKEELLKEEFDKKYAELVENEGLTREEWFSQYKQLLKEYEGIAEAPITIYDQYTSEELDLLFRVVQAEIGDEYGFDEKCNVCSVIFNRILGSKFPNTLYEVLTPNQFSTIKNGRIYDVAVSEKTIAACEYVFLFGDTTGGALYFESLRSNVHSSYAEYIFTDNGHKFYK